MGGYFDISGCSVNMIHSEDSTLQLNEPEKANKKSEKLSVNTSPSQGHLFLPSHDLLKFSEYCLVFGSANVAAKNAAPWFSEKAASYEL